MTTIEEQIKLLQAVADGKTLQFNDKQGLTGWRDASPDWHNGIKQGAISMAVDRYNWRVKPEPAVRWINEYSNSSSIAHLSESEAKEAGKYGLYERLAVKYQEVL